MKTLITIATLQFIGLAAYAADAYPITTCVVSGEKLGEMGKPYVFEYNGQEVQLCCEHCKGKFEKSPDKYLEKLAKPDSSAVSH